MTAEMAGESSAEKHIPDLLGSHESMDDIFDGAFNEVPEASLHDSTESFENAFDDETKTDEKSSRKDESTKKPLEIPTQTTSMNSEDNVKEPMKEPSRIGSSSQDSNTHNENGWQNDAADIPHRRELIRQIAQLLKDRKQNPTQKWLKELPYKARKLEEQLYKSASSLEAYLDESTLKHRLKKVAYAITSQFHIAKGGTKKKKQGTSAVTSGSSIGQSTSSNQPVQQPTQFDRRLSVDPQGDANGEGGMSFENKNEGAMSLDDKGGGGSNAINVSGSDGGGGGGGGGLSAIEQQQQANQKLQDQILENIRQQQEIMKNLMANNNSGGANSSDAANNLNNSTNDQQGLFGNAQNQVADNSMLAAMTSQGLINSVGGQQAMNVSNQMTGMGGGTMGLNANGLTGMNAGLGNFNAGGLNQSGMDGSGGLNLSAGGGMNTGLGTAGGVNPLLAQQLMQQRMQMQGSSQAQMAMMNNVLRNSLTGQSNPTALNAAFLASNMNSASGSGINPTMPPPNMNSVTRSSFSANNSAGLMGGANDMLGGGARNNGSGDPSLSPTSFQW